MSALSRAIRLPRRSDLISAVRVGAVRLGILLAMIFTSLAHAETWADYSMMNGRRAAQLWSGSVVTSQFAWAPQSGSESHIYWGDPASWPPTYHERFIHNGDWVMLDGWWGNSTYYTINVTSDQLCDANCANCSAIATSGAQHYTKWTVSAVSYCMIASGTITEASSGSTINFAHTQLYFPSAACSNAYYSAQTCIRQWESWSDDNGTVFGVKVQRDSYLARGIGTGFVMHQYFPSSWQADLRYYWDY